MEARISTMKTRFAENMHKYKDYWLLAIIIAAVASVIGYFINKDRS